MNKKEIIKALETYFRVKAKYLFLPSCAYEIKTAEETYIVDREGTVRDSQGKEIELDTILAGDKDTTTVEPETTIDEMVVTVPIEGHTGITLRNLVNMIYSKQKLIRKALGFEEKLIEDGLIAILNENKPATTEDFKALLVEAGNQTYPGLSIDFEEGIITLKLNDLSEEQTKACSQMLGLINQNAKTLKHASSKQSETDNEKYAFRTWLIRLGMIGNEYKAARKTLLANLEGNGAFRKPEHQGDNGGQENG